MDGNTNNSKTDNIEINSDSSVINTNQNTSQTSLDSNQPINENQTQKTSVTPNISPIPKTKPLKILFLGLTLLLIILILAGTYLFLQNQKPSFNKENQSTTQELPTPTLDQTSAWKTYINNKYSYSFSYKEVNTLEFRSCGDSPSNYIGEENVVFMEIPNSYNICYPLDWIADIHIFVTEGNKTTENAIDKDYPTTDYEIQNEEINIDGVKAHKIKSHFVGKIDEDGYGFSPPDLTEVRVYNNNYTYFLYLGNEAYKETYNQILSTFEFIE